jgi:hypothetical protein
MRWSLGRKASWGHPKSTSSTQRPKLTLSAASAGRSVVPSPLERVNTTANNRQHAEQDYRHALSKAREAGHTFEEIAEAAGVTRSAVFQILNPKERTK